MRKLLIIDNCEDCPYSFVRYDDDCDHPGLSLFCEYGDRSDELFDDVPDEGCPLPNAEIRSCIKLFVKD